MNRRRLSAICGVSAMTALLLLGLLPAPALAQQQTAEPAVLNLGWWWKQAQSEEIDVQGNKVVVDSPNPFCPSVPGSLGAVPGACAEGRFPVHIQGGEYDEPEMLSGLGFDLSYLTPGSTVTKFEVKLLEAEPSCTDKNDDGVINPNEGDYCENTQPIGPVDERQVRACQLTQIFGDAEGRPYKEVPNYQCSPGDPLAERKEIKSVDPDTDPDGIDHVWTFDLTPFAQQWAESFTVATNIMLVGQKPKETDGQDTWRVVFAGPKAEKGIRTKLVYEPGEFEIALPPPPPPTGGSTFGDTTSFGGSDTGGSFGTTPTGPTGAAPVPGTAPSPGANPDLGQLAAEIPQPESMPAYVWLALIAGLVGFSLFRQAVIESTTGVRPDGVLAKIHALNAERRGLDAAAVEGPSALSGFAAVGRSIGHAVGSLVDKLPFRRK